jgi:hypothetical protein
MKVSPLQARSKVPLQLIFLSAVAMWEKFICNLFPVGSNLARETFATSLSAFSPVLYRSDFHALQSRTKTFARFGKRSGLAV